MSLITKHQKHTGTPEYRAWAHLKARCSNPNVHNYADYGGRGIRNDYNDFAEFIADVGRRPSKSHSIDRIENDGHYSPGNCRWATRVEQATNNRRNKKITHRERTLTIAEWSRETGIDHATIWSRWKAGYTPEKILMIGKQSGGKRISPEVRQAIRSSSLSISKAATLFGVGTTTVTRIRKEAADVNN